jgi:hypothetical protein
MAARAALWLEGSLAAHVGWLLVVAVAFLPPFLLLLLQGMGVGTGTAIAGTVQFSDALGWLDCGSLARAGRFDELARTDWCLRRPEVFMLSLPVHWLAAGAVANLVVVQALLLALAWLALAIVVVRTLHIAPLTVAGALVVVAWMSLRFAMSTGAEWASLTLAVLSLAAALQSLSSRAILLGPAAIVLSAFAMRARPGNPVLVLTLAVVVVHTISARVRPRTAVLVAGVSLVVGVFIISTTLRALGIENAGHGGNFWATAYAAADPASSSFKDANAACAAAGITREIECWNLLRTRTLQLVREDPFPLVRQLFKNLVQFGVTGPYARLFGPEIGSGLPHSFADVVRELRSGNAFPFVANLALALVWPFVVISLAWRCWRTRPSSGGDALFCVHTAGRVGANPRWLLTTFALASMGGAAIVFAVVGHDDGRRHLVMSAPLFWLALLLSLPVRDDAKMRPIPTRVLLLASAVACSVILIVFLSTSRVADSLHVRGACDAPPKESEKYDVVAFVPLETSHLLSTPSSGRISSRARPGFVLGLREGYKANVDELPSGALLTLFSRDNGRTRSAFIGDAVLARVTASVDPLDLCFGAPPDVGKAGALGLPALLLLRDP